MTGKFLTPNEPALSGSFYIMLTLPNSVEFRQHMKGALYELTQEFNWEEFGTMSPEDAAERWSTILNQIQDVPMLPVGMFIYTIATVGQANWIACVGGSLLMADWPELMAIYPSAAKNQPSAGRFIVPNLAGRFLTGSGVSDYSFNFPFLSVGGQRQVTLNTTQIPAHVHTEIQASPTIINGGLEAPASAAIPVAGNTGSAGGGQPHENMPPYYVFTAFMIGRALP